MSLFQDTANATVRIECGSSRGSGFHFLRPEIIVTNHHVVQAHDTDGETVVAITEAGDRLNLTQISLSPASEDDFAIFRVDVEIPEGRKILFPKIPASSERGKEIVFSGFPHGIPHLLVQRGVISGRINDNTFYIDAAVNGGNSGGPIIDPGEGTVIGIITQRRFLGAQELQRLGNDAEQLRRHCQNIARRGSAKIMGIDFGGFSGMMADAMLLLRKTLEANANTGIGIVFSIESVAEKCESEGIRAEVS